VFFEYFLCFNCHVCRSCPNTSHALHLSRQTFVLANLLNFFSHRISPRWIMNIFPSVPNCSVVVSCLLGWNDSKQLWLIRDHMLGAVPCLEVYVIRTTFRYVGHCYLRYIRYTLRFVVLDIVPYEGIRDTHYASLCWTLPCLEVYVIRTSFRYVGHCSVWRYTWYTLRFVMLHLLLACIYFLVLFFDPENGDFYCLLLPGHLLD
jgi:hypothetical protein